MRALAISLALSMLLTGSALAKPRIVLGPGDEALRLDVLESTPERTLIRFELRHFDLRSHVIDGVEHVTPVLAGYPQLYERGLPQLPKIAESLLIPDDRAMSLRLLQVEERDFQGRAVAPSKGILPRKLDPDAIPHVFDEFYAQDAWYPAEPAELGDPYIMRDTRGIVLTLKPFSYHPATRTLRVVRSMTVEIRAEGPATINRLDSRPERRAAEFEKLYAHHYLNWSEAGADRYTDVPESGDMLVICHDAFRQAAQPFVDWKNQMGIRTELVDVSAVGSTGAQIKAYIQDRYDNEGLCFILLVGDAAQVPPYQDVSASDPSYALLAGDDGYPDAFVGRLSAENPDQVQTQVQRTIEYERDAQALADWYHKGTGLGSTDGPMDDDEHDWEHIEVIRGKLLDFTYTHVDQIYDPEANIQMVADAVNEGRSIINYSGHGGPQGWGTSGFSNVEVNTLVNVDMLPVISSVACNTGEFHTGTCLAEAWLRATHEGEPTGGIAMYASTVGMTGPPPMCSQDEFIDLLVDEEKRCYGALCFLGTCQMIDEYGDIGVHEYKHWTVFGDPSLRVRTDRPAALAAQHLPTLSYLATEFFVLTDPGNLAALSHEGACLGSAFADAQGEAHILVDGNLPPPGAEITLTLTGFNRFTRVEPILVVDDLLPSCEIDPESFTVVMAQDQLQTAALHISNQGEPGSTLHYFIDIEDPDYPRDRDAEDRDMTGSYAWSDLDEYLAHESYTAGFHLYNGSDDGEYVARFTMDLPPGVVLESEPGPITGGYDGDIPYVGETGDGAFCDWSVPPGEWGRIFPGQVGDVMLDLRFSEALGDVAIPYVIYGDVWGEEPHEVSGEIHIAMRGPSVTLLSPDGGEVWAIGETRAISFTGEGGPEHLRIELSRDGGFGGSWETLAESVPLAAGGFDWPVTGPVSADCVVKVTDAADPAITDFSDEPFTIYRELSWVRLSAQQGSVPAGETQTLEVTFDATGLPAGDYRANLVVVSNAGEFVTVPVDIAVFDDPTASEEATPTLALGPNHPNPFNPSTVIPYSLSEPGLVTLSVFDVSGRRIKTLVNAVQPAGLHLAVWNGRDGGGRALASGIYFSRLDAGGSILKSKMLLLK